jgi:hypothetical protein
METGVVDQVALKKDSDATCRFVSPLNNIHLGYLNWSKC